MMTQSLPYDPELVIGDCWPINVTWKPGGVAGDLTGYEARFRAWTSDGAVDFELSSEEGSPAELALGGALGTIEGEVPSEETETWPEGKKVKYRLWLIQPDGCPRTILRGTFRMRA